MANDSAASSARKRLTRKTPPKQPDPPEVALARSLLTTEYAVRGARPGSEARSGKGQSAWDQLADELARFIDRLRGRSPSAGGAPGGGGGGDTGGVGQAEPHSAQAMRSGPPQQPLSAGSLLSSRAAFEGTIDQLPPSAREAFEDAVLHLVRTEKKWKKAYDKAPAGMPSVAMYANNAYLRELRRNAPRAPSRRRGSEARRRPSPSDGHGRGGHGQRPGRHHGPRSGAVRAAPRPLGTPCRRSGELRHTVAPEQLRLPLADDMTDGHGFREAERINLAERTNSTTVIPRAGDTFGAHDFLAAESTYQSSLLGDDAYSTVSGLEPPAPPVQPTPTPVPPPLQNESALRSPLPAAADLVSPFPAHATPVSPFPGEATPVSPLASPATPVSTPSSPTTAHSLLSSEGQQVLRDTRDAFPTASGSRGADSSTRAATPVPVRKASNASTARR